MAYADFTGKIIKHSWGRFRGTSGEALSCGDLVDIDMCEADASAGENGAKFIACQDIASGDVGWFCTKAEVQKPASIATGGGVTRGDHGGTAGDILFLSTTQGTAVEVPDGDGLLQAVGTVLTQDTVLYDPSPEIFYLMEYEIAAKTLGASDSGKVFACGAAPSTDVIVTLPSAAANSGYTYTIVNVNQDGDALIQVSPNSVDTIIGADVAETDNKDLINTKSTQRCMDMVRVVASAGASAKSGFCVTDIRGTWAIES